MYQGRQFISLNKGKAYGYLRKVKAQDIGKTVISKRDIVILDGLPNELPVVAGGADRPISNSLMSRQPVFARTENT